MNIEQSIYFTLVVYPRENGLIQPLCKFYVKAHSFKLENVTSLLMFNNLFYLFISNGCIKVIFIQILFYTASRKSSFMYID